MKVDRKGKILIVDDDERNQRLMMAMLSPLEHEIHVARDGEEALELLHRVEPDLILLDIMMPNVNGYQVLEKIKGDTRTMDIPVVMLTALTDTDSRIRAFDLGADDFISKPPERTEVTARIRSLMKVKAYHDSMARYREDLEREVARITEQLHFAYKNLKAASLDTIYRLTQASEYKDEDTGEHIQRVSRLSQAIAREMGFPDQMQESLLYAAPMHDVGKIGIPDEILLKPASLDAREWAIMKTHSQIGARILGGSSNTILRMGEEVAMTHHERWDGGGYPEGLGGERIPIAGRIVAVADVYDALTSQRPYRPPIPEEKAMTLVTEGAGSQFDPDVVDAFLSLGKEISEIRTQVQQGGTGRQAKGIVQGSTGYQHRDNGDLN